MRRLTRGLAAPALCVALLAGCGPSVKRPLVAEALDDPDDRREDFEAVLRVLDEHPDYVDEFFQQALDHPATLDRFIANAAGSLDDYALAQMTARHLAQNPDALEQVLVATLRAADERPRARQAIASAIGEKVDRATGILTDDPEVVQKTLLATVDHVAQKPEARRAFVQALYGASPALARILASNPKTLTKMFEELSSELSKEPGRMVELVEQLGG